MKSGEPMALAGIWNSWQNPTVNVPLETYAVITVAHDALVETFHKKMSAILLRDELEKWLAPADQNQRPLDLIRPIDPELMTM